MNPQVDAPLELFFDQLRDLYSMEVQLCESMPNLMSLCTNAELHDLIDGHAQQNGNQILEIAEIFERHGKPPGGDECKAMAGLIEGGTAHLEGVPSPHTRDLMIIAHCLRIELYEMAAYESTILLSGRLGLMREPAILSELLAEEKEMAAALMKMKPNIFRRSEVALDMLMPGSVCQTFVHQRAEQDLVEQADIHAGNRQCASIAARHVAGREKCRI